MRDNNGCAADDGFNRAFHPSRGHKYRSQTMKRMALMHIQVQFRTKPALCVHVQEISTQATTAIAIGNIFVHTDHRGKHSPVCHSKYFQRKHKSAYDIEAAAQIYFNKSASKLNFAESAFLAGLPQAPAFYDPVIYREVALARMDDVITLMEEANGNGCVKELCITPNDAEEKFLAERVAIEITTFSPPDFSYKYPHFVDYVWEELLNIYPQTSLYRLGLNVYTTLQPTIQEVAQQAIRDEIPITVGMDNRAVLVVKPTNGAILAMVGSADFYNAEIGGQVNVLFTLQQPGSTIKPFIYLATLEGKADNDYWYPGQLIWDVPTCWGDYCPTNLDHRYLGPIPMRFALGQSINTPAVRALDYIGIEPFTNLLNRLNMAVKAEQIDLPSALGATDVVPFELAIAYTALANQGFQSNPYSIEAITDRAGKLIYSAQPSGDQVIRPEHAYLITHMLADPDVKVSENLNIAGWEVATKTGTTNDNRDVWTIGYTTEAVVLVWVGRTDNQPMGSSTFGANTSSPIWNKTMQAVVSGLPVHDFLRPAAILEISICSATGALYEVKKCPTGDTVEEIIYIDQPPIENFQSKEICNDNAILTWLRETEDGITWLSTQGQVFENICG